ncbi:hypothetical protein TPA0905_38260 [Streptomyces olivaceus]|nr:hypothetical protein TPA0905_38260 [Streptomyces olivaceus]
MEMLVVPGCADVLAPRAQPPAVRTAAPAATPARKRRRASGTAALLVLPDADIDHLHGIGPPAWPDVKHRACDAEETPELPGTCCVEVNDTIPVVARVARGKVSVRVTEFGI